MIQTTIHDLYLEFTGKKDNQITHKDATLENLVLWDLLSSPYLQPDYQEIIPYYDKGNDYLWLKKSSKFIPGKNGNNLVLESTLDCASMHVEKGFEDIKNNSSYVLNSVDNKIFGKIKNILSSDAGLDVIEMLKEEDETKIKSLFPETSEELQKGYLLLSVNNKKELERKLETDNLEEEKAKVIKNFGNKLTSLIKEKEKDAVDINEIKNNSQGYKEFREFVFSKLDYGSKLKETPKEKEIQYKVFYIDDQDGHYKYNKWVSGLNPVQTQSSVWKNYGEKGLFYLTPIAPENGFTKKYMIVAHNDLEVVGVTQLNDMNSALSGRKDPDAYKMPYIGIQAKYRGCGVATQLFKRVMDIIEKDQKFLMRTAPSEMGGKYTQAKFTEMGKDLKVGILINSEEGTLYENFKSNLEGTGLEFQKKRDIYKILKEELHNKLRTDKTFYFEDADKLMSDPVVLNRLNDEVFAAPKEKAAKKSKLKI